MAEIRLLIADDHVVLRAGLRMLLDAQSNMKVIAEADNGAQVLALAVELQPDLILLDLTMPNLGGLEALPLLRRAVPGTRILILTMHDDESYLRQALRDGASGYVLKKAADTELISAIHSVMRGEVYIHASMTRFLIEELLPADVGASTNPWDNLSEREREVLLLVARGYTSAKIAERISLSPKTVETYRARGMEKLDLRSRAALVQFALSHNLLDQTQTP